VTSVYRRHRPRGGGGLVKQVRSEQCGACLRDTVVAGVELLRVIRHALPVGLFEGRNGDRFGWDCGRSRLFRPFQVANGAGFNQAFERLETIAV
jgi:hypothetical protein